MSPQLWQYLLRRSPGGQQMPSITFNLDLSVLRDLFGKNQEQEKQEGTMPVSVMNMPSPRIG